MKVSNLHSLLNDRWFVDSAYGRSLLPTLYTILSGTADFNTGDSPIEAHVVVGKNATIISAKSFEETNNKDQYVLVVSLKNPIYKYNQECGPRGTKHKMAFMASYENDPNLAGVVLDIDSGGGQVAGTPEFHDFVKNYSKPVVSYTDGMMCSAAYYIGSAADHIVANKRADAIGSIGTMISFIDMTGYYEKKGAKVVTEYATKSTDKNKDFEELLKGNPEGYIKNQLDPITEEFHADMKAARSGLDEAVLSGGTYKANQALKMGLVDELGTLQTAIDKVFSLAQKNKGNSNNLNSKRTTMSNTKLPLIEGVLGQKFEEDETKDGIILSDDQAAKIETALSNNATAIADAKKAAEKSTETINTLKADSTTVTTAIQNALKEAEVEGAEKMSNEEGISALSALVKEYGSDDGATHTQTTANTESKGAFKGAADNKLSEIVN